mgnify:CR=1 FL=1
MNTIDLIKNPQYSPWLNMKKVSYKSKTSDSYKNHFKHFLPQEKNFLEYLKLYNYLNKNFPDIKFLIKPHPAENHNYYNQMIKKNKFSNIQILNITKSIIPYIQASEALIAFNSTSLVESFILKKTSLQKGGTKIRVPEITKIKKLGFKPKFNLRMGLQQTVNHK